MLHSSLMPITDSIPLKIKGSELPQKQPFTSSPIFYYVSRWIRQCKQQVSDVDEATFSRAAFKGRMSTGPSRDLPHPHRSRNTKDTGTGQVSAQSLIPNTRERPIL